MNKKLNEFINKQKQQTSVVNVVYIFVVFYALFVLKRFKAIGSLVVDGYKTNNVIFLIALALIVIGILTLNKETRDKNQIILFVSLLTLIFLVCMGMFFVDNFDQSIYAALIFLLPLGFLLFTKKQTHKQFVFTIKILALFSMIYSVITLVAAFNYKSIMDILGNTGNFEERARAALPLGGSITVSYYLNISLPLLFLMWGESEKKTSKVVFVVAIVLNVIATLVQLSRSAVVTCGIILVGEIVLQLFSKKGVGKWILLGVLAVVVVFVAIKVDLSRLVTNIFDGNKSDQSRFAAANLGLHVFKKNFMFGTGVGSYFIRVWKNSGLSVDGVVGLVDPHCAYILLLSEVGIVGTILYGAIIVSVVLNILQIKNKDVCVPGLFIVIALILNSIWGSQLVNEASFTAVAFIYLALFMGYSKNKKNGEN